MESKTKQFFAPSAWVQGAWAKDVLLSVDAGGHWCKVEVEANPADSASATHLSGPVMPSLVNAHSHAFQRAIVGLTEHRSTNAAAKSDDFWSWRDRMYSVALRLSPEQLEHIATMLYAELLAAGYTQVCEFHYLHNAVDGKPYANPLDMSLALVRAAKRVGMGLTLLPTLYMRSGFAATGLRDDQRRFATTPNSIFAMIEGIQRETHDSPLINAGVAIHSLRAVDIALVQEVAAYAKTSTLPVHIHIAEQTQEVNDCMAYTGRRPIEWLYDNVALDGRWNLVHATHTTQAELKAIQSSGASIVICPSTEANLGDGIFDYTGYAAVGGQWSVGSDSHVTRSWTEELRLLEYSQRLTLRQRNVAAQFGASASSAVNLFEGALRGGQSATSRNLGGIKVGNRADFVVLDMQSSSFLGMPIEYALDALVFSSPNTGFSNVYVAGNNMFDASSFTHSETVTIKQNFAKTMKKLFN